MKSIKQKTKRRNRLQFTIFFLVMFIFTGIVHGQPNWVPTPNLQYTMSIVAKVQLSNGNYSVNPFDILAAFVGNECRGVISPLDPPNEDFFFLSVGSNISGELLTFKAYLASTGEIVNLNESFQFVILGEVGTMVDPFIYTCETSTYVISAVANQNGSISPSGNIVINPGDNQTFIITPNNNYNIANILVDGQSVGAVSTYTFTNVTSNHSIEATFELDESGVTQLSWRFANPRIIRVSNADRLEFDVQVKASEAGTLFWSGQFNIKFNNNAFSTVANDVITVRDGISSQLSENSGDNKYNIVRTVSGANPNVVINVALIPSDISILDGEPSTESSAEMTTSWQTFLKLRLKLNDASALSGISFIRTAMNGQESFHGGPGIISYYQNPNLYITPELDQLWLGRIYSSLGWSQAGGSVNNVQFTDWTVPVNTSIWDGQPLLDGPLFLANKLTIHENAVLTVKDNSSLSVQGDLSNLSGATGLVLQSSAASTASLIHNSNNVQASVQRYISGSDNLTQMKYHLVSMPITTGALSGWWLDSYLYRFDAPTQDWVAMGTSTTTPLAGDQGYMVYYPGVEKTYSFSGPLFNGPTPLSVSYYSAGEYEGLNLVPNPFPSAIDWDSPAGWTKTNISNAFWIWNPQAGNYASYGSYGTLNATQFIPQGQAFFVEASTNGPALVVNNSARVHSSQAFFKNSDPPGLLRFRAQANMMEDEMLVVFDQAASPAYDPQEDVVKLFGSDMAPQLFSLLQNEDKLLTINTLNLPGEGCTVPIGFQLEEASPVTLSFINMKIFDPNFDLLLEDLVTGLTYDLRAQDFLDIDHSPGNNVNRFLLHVALITGLNEGFSSACKFWANENKVYFTHHSAPGTLLKVRACDPSGRLLADLNLYNSSVNSFFLPGCKGLILVSVEDEKGVSTGKIFLNSSL